MPRCFHCGKEFSVTGKRTRKHCSVSCRSAAFRERNKARLMRTRFCKNCGKEYQTTDRRKIYCSPHCNWEVQNARRETTKYEDRKCPVCGIVFKPKQKRGVGRKFCSKICLQKDYEERNKHKRKNGVRRYLVKNKWEGNWYKALVRDKFTCQLCGLKVRPSQWSSRRKLVVHHRDGSGESTNKNHSLDNLMTLCDYCHREFHTRINLIYRDGEYYVSGRVFSLLGLSKVKTAPKLD